MRRRWRARPNDDVVVVFIFGGGSGGSGGGGGGGGAWAGQPLPCRSLPIGMSAGGGRCDSVRRVGGGLAVRQWRRQYL
jgi:hypothetical protein